MTPQEKQQFPQHDAEAITVNLIRSVQDNATSLIRFWLAANDDTVCCWPVWNKILIICRTQ